MKRGTIIFTILLIAAIAIIAITHAEEKDKESLPFIRGDTNIDGEVDISDAIYLLTFLYSQHDNIACLDSADINDNGKVDITDASYLIDFLLVGNIKEIPPPNTKEEIDLTEDNLKC